MKNSAGSAPEYFGEESTLAHCIDISALPHCFYQKAAINRACSREGVAKSLELVGGTVEIVLWICSQ